MVSEKGLHTGLTIIALHHRNRTHTSMIIVKCQKTCTANDDVLKDSSIQAFP